MVSHHYHVGRHARLTPSHLVALVVDPCLRGYIDYLNPLWLLQGKPGWAIDTYERGLIAHVQGLQTPVAEMKPAQPKRLRLKVNPYEGKEAPLLGPRDRARDGRGSNLDRATSSRFRPIQPRRSGEDLGVHARSDNAGLFHNLGSALRAAFLPANFEYRQRSRFLAWKCELHEYIQEMRVLAASLVGNPLPEHIKVTVFMDGLKVGPSRTQLFRVHANTMEEAIQIALQEAYSHRQTCTPTPKWQGHNTSSGAVQGAPAAGASTGLVPMELGTAVQSSIRCFGYGKLGYMKHTFSVGGQRKFPSKSRGSRGPWQKPRPKSQRKQGPGLGEVTAVNVLGVRMDLAVKFEDFDSTESFLVLEMDKYDLILGMPWREKHEPWVDWRGKAIGASRPAVSDRALVSNVPTSVRDWGASDGRQGAYAPEEVLGVTDSNEDVAMSLATGRETKAHCQACGIATTASPDAESRHAVWASTVAVPGGTDQAGNIGPQAAEAAEESAKGVSGVGNIGPQAETKKKNENDTCISSVCNRVPRGVNKTSVVEHLTNHHIRGLGLHRARPAKHQCNAFGGVSGRQVKPGAVHLEAVLEDFLAELKDGGTAGVVLLKPETYPENVNFSSVIDEDGLEGFTNQGAMSLGSGIFKNPKEPVYPLVKEHVIDLVPGTKHCVTRKWHLPRKQCEVIDAFFVEKAKSGMVRESKFPTFCVRKPSGKWRLVHPYNKLNNATVPAQTPIPRKDVLLNNMSGCTLYSALDLVDGYYQILMRESDIPLTAVSTPSGMLWEWLVMPQGLSNSPATFNRLTYFDDIFVHNRVEEGQTVMEVHLKHLRRVFEVMRANKLYANIEKCVFAAEEIKGLGCFVSRVDVRADPGKVKPIAAWPTQRSQKDLREWLGLVNYLHKYSPGYAELARPLSDLLKKDVDWVWEQQHQDSFDSIKATLRHAPVLTLSDETKSVRVVCDAYDYEIGYVRLQMDDKEREHIISISPRVNGVYPVLLEWATTPPGAANLAGRHRCLHRKCGRGSENLFLPRLRY
ncbi:LOW QUALITY PROTEIN: Pol protein [Phytophthora palmivora]|uniref:Pol protein n=1 Tax=Phytophthora palmivora TaxID=4796 RepID=A0A2P4YKD6_9STRA|nr:LOW QUALITY PROTEIN: Pol protein [Phytophthora palmivora]